MGLARIDTPARLASQRAWLPRPRGLAGPAGGQLFRRPPGRWLKMSVGARAAQNGDNKNRKEAKLLIFIWATGCWPLDAT